MKNLAVARRYAKALLLIGKEDGQTETYRKELEGFSRLLEREKALAQTISNPLYRAANRERVLKAVIERLKLSRVMSSFLLLLFAKRRILFLSSINEFYQKLADAAKGVARARLVTAMSLSDDTVEKIRTALSKLIGKEVVIEMAEDSSLIGGVVTQIGDLVLDGSIKTQLRNMRESLKRGESV